MPLNRERYVAWAVRHGRLVWTMALLLAIPASFRTVDLYAHLKSDFEKLLPRESPSVQALEELRARLSSDRFLGVMVDAGDATHLNDANRFIDALVTRVHTYPAGMVRSIDTGGGASDEGSFFRHNAALYVDYDDLETIYDRVRDRRRWEVMRGTFGSIDDSEQPPSLDFGDLRAKYDWALPHGATRGDRYASPDLHLSLALMRVGADVDGGDLYSRLTSDTRALRISDYGPGMRVGFSGDIAATTEETEALLTDLSFASVLVMLAVTFVIVAYYRWWRAVLALMPPVLLAMVYAFALASLPPFSVTELNSNTAFLGSIIVGNGINVGIILVARYVEERRRGFDVKRSLETGVGASAAGTLAAAVAAGVAYASLGITQFRGFRQFGAIGALGMVFAWALAYLLTPSLLAKLDHSEKTRPRAFTPAFSRLGGLATFVSRYYVLILLIVTGATGLSLQRVLLLDHRILESDFSKLRRSDTWTSGEGYWGNRMNDLLGRYLSPLVILSDSPEDANAIADNLRRHLNEAPFAGALATVRTAADLVPSDMPRKIELVGKLRALVGPDVLEGIPASDRDLVSSFLGQRELHVLTLTDVPASIRDALRERDGSTGKVVLVYPRVNGEALWDGDRLSQLVHGLRDIAATSVPEGHVAGRLAGGLPLSADILAAIRDDGLNTCLFAFFGVLAVVMLIVRRVGATALIIASLSLGVLFQLAALLVFHIKLNFANFIALPITFGVGVDYAVNVMTRYMNDGRRDIEGAVAATGGAVVLCSLTTIIGYASLLVAKNQALYLFGALAVIGEICCLITAVIILPSVLVLARQRHSDLDTSRELP